MSVFLDTNVLAYLFDDDAGSKQEAARTLLAQRAGDAVISTQVMVELHAVLTGKLGRSRAEARRVLEALDLEIEPTDAALVLRAAVTAAEHKLSIFDALVLEAAAAAGCEELYTEGLTAGSALRGVTIRNPFVD